MSAYDDERLGELLRALPPPPRDWVERARALPGQGADRRAVTGSRRRLGSVSELLGGLAPASAGLALAHMQTAEPLPAWSLSTATAEELALASSWPERVTREWAWGGSAGKGARVCIVDSGIERDHPLVGPVEEAIAVSVEGDDVLVEEDDAGDPLRARDRVRGDRPLARARVSADERPRPRSRLHRERRGSPRRASLGARAGLRRRQHEPLDHQA